MRAEPAPVLEPYALLDTSSEAAARQLLLRCCGAARWVDGMLARRPFGSRAGLLGAARSAFSELAGADYLAAFAQHPPIGGNLAVLRAEDSRAAALSGAEQAGVASADQATLNELTEANAQYRRRFGYVFLVCATGKSAPLMLELLRARLRNDAETELAVAAAELVKISELRLEKLSP